MPQLGHGLVGLGVAAATYPHVRSGGLRSAWFGLGVTLAYLPDLVEWGLRWMDLRPVHSAPASLLALALSCAVAVGALRVVFRESSPVALAGACAAIGSHTLLDALDGGVPLLWPWSSASIGADLLAALGDAPGGRLGLELLVFAPLTLLGALCGAIGWRSPGASRAARRGPLRHGWQLVALSPVLILGAFQVMAWREMKLGYACHNRGEYEAAIPHYQRAADLRPVDWEGAARFRVDYCLFRAGHEREALSRFLAALQADPRSFAYNSGLAELYLLARDATLRRPADGRALLDRLERLASNEEERTYARLLRERVDQTLAAEAGGRGSGP